MAQRLKYSDPDFQSAFKAFLSKKREASVEVDSAVRPILANVREKGDLALIDYTEAFDGVTLSRESLRVSQDEIDEAAAKAPPEHLSALKFAYERIHAHHEKQKPQDQDYTDALGVRLGARWRPIAAVGLYVPGGTACYPSSVLMNAAPAEVAGVKRIVMATPAPEGKLNPLVLAAARLCNVREIYRIGGAQAIAALAYGTESILPVDKIVGPGNAYVAAAKRQVFGTVGIDMIAGPSEVLIVADKSANAAWIAADLLAQAEHDEAARCILITDDETLGGQVEACVESQLQSLSRQETARTSWQEQGAIILVPDISVCAGLVDAIAPEHLELCTEEPEALLAAVNHAGAIFLGAHTPEAVGDYVAGSNHVLPTAGSARFSSGLSVLDFMKRSSLLQCAPDSLHRLGPPAITLAEVEGLGAHARSIAIRLNASKPLPVQRDK